MRLRSSFVPRARELRTASNLTAISTVTVPVQVIIINRTVHEDRDFIVAVVERNYALIKPRVRIHKVSASRDGLENIQYTGCR